MSSSSAPLPRVVGSSRACPAVHSGATWRLAEPTRGLDANLIELPAGDGIGEHDGPGLDVLVHVVGGSGELLRDAEPLPITAGDLVWLPADARRGFCAGPDGLRYLTVHARKPGLQIGSRPPGGE